MTIFLAASTPKPDDWRWPNFGPDELRCKHCGELRIQEAFLDVLQAERTATGFPWKINSAYRCPRHDRDIGGKGNHPQGKAVDVALAYSQASLVVARARDAGFTGLGVRQHGPTGERYLHLDISHEFWTVWSY